MDYRDRLHENNTLIEERYSHSLERIRELAVTGPGGKMPSASGFYTYFTEVARFLFRLGDVMKRISEGTYLNQDEEKLAMENRDLYQDILPEAYQFSFANPVWAVKELGEEYGKILSFLYTELRSQIVFAFEQDLTGATLLNELFLEVSDFFSAGEASYRGIREIIHRYINDSTPYYTWRRIREQLDPDQDFAVSIIMDSDLLDLRYLYAYGEYISEDEMAMADYLNSLPQEVINEIARTFTEGYRKGFVIKNVDLSKKKTVNIRYSIGFERIIRASILYFKEMGLSPVIYRCAYSTLIKKQNLRTGYISTDPNPQYGYDHRFDEAIYLERRMIDRKLSCMREAYEEFAADAAGFAGPAVFEVFGQEPFKPESKPEAYQLSERQQMLSVDYASQATTLANEFINQEERSYTIIAYPMPCIGPEFPEIFQAIHRVNTLDETMYEKIQQIMIDTLDQADYVKIMGRGSNMTNLTVSLIDIEDPASQTKFENCLADVNIPLGEVFTSPKLKDTNGLLHVTEVYLNDLCYKDLKLWFENGMITEYSCANFPDPEEGKKFIKENLLFNHDTLPVGELAIGTNTTAYVMASGYGIKNKLPILIAEKMGPHLAVGDTCYSYTEDIPVFNPNGKEIVARDNECSIKRKEDQGEAYFNCHTDITIPYEELGRIVAGITRPVGENTERLEIPIILEGRFVLEGTFELNEPFQDQE